MLSAGQLLPHPSLLLSVRAGSNQLPNFSWGLSQCRSLPGPPYLIRVAGIPRSASRWQTPVAAFLFLLRPSRTGAPGDGQTPPASPGGERGCNEKPRERKQRAAGASRAEGELNAPRALGTGLLVAGHWEHRPAAGAGQQEEKPPAAMHLAPRQGNHAGQAGNFCPLLPSKALGKRDTHEERARNASASPRYLIVAKLGERQPGGPAPASKTFRPTGELEMLFVFLPGQLAMSSGCQLLCRAGDGNTLGSEQAPGHPHPPPALENGPQWQEPTQPGAQKLEPNCIVQRCERTQCSGTVLLLHPYPEIPSPIAPIAPQAALGKDLCASCRRRFATDLKAWSHSPLAPHAAWVEGQTRPPPSEVTQLLGELAQPGGHLPSRSRGTAGAVFTAL